ncbi:hypothetical protein ASPZODRAFT_57105 [Penicilliopsis zonata CBS 506.65]|uniref:RFTS domain-containing protein n=1 Tax=Penicilliopsis zonata CBS 506.65 TaxID=1073090 RepID=A0A1L9SV09_9EURO|nr:hypothetical protein ASPZODRAFT_57105 [Penicilliopsis zonata CBS 506.65]OJJ50976.1 hypothetical protein ASPZODRAFT_57105 [Penicilliopsis zonata CBS 506.65]
MTSREESVLAARDPSLVDENDWEEFSLAEVKVLIPGKWRYANLINASPDNPVQVTGCLEEVEEAQEKLVIDEDYISKRIVIDNVTHYAYGQHADGEVGIWVAGRAGWFSITPARGYRPMFNEMVEAIDLLYFLADRLQSKRRKQKTLNPSVEYLCEEYVIHTHGICEDADDSLEVIHKHCAFLLSRMLKGEEGVEWTKTDLFKHLCENFPEEYDRAQDMLNPKSEDQEDEDDDNGSEDNEANGIHNAHDEMTDAPTFSSDEASIFRTQAEAIYQVIMDLKEAGHLAKRQLNLELVASNLLSGYDIDSVEHAHDLIAARAGFLVEMMDHAKTSNFDWSRKVIYRELKAVSKQTKNHIQHIALTPLRPRIADSEDSSSEESEHEVHPRARKRRVRKSVLRPKSAISAKQIGKRTRSSITANEGDPSDESQEEDVNELDTPSKVRGHEFVRDPLSTRAKRRTRSILSNSGIPSPQKTPLHEILQITNVATPPTEHETSDEMDTIDLEGYPPDTWICQVQGCGKVVLKSGSKRGKDLIQDHALAHADDTQTKLDLVLAEQRLNVGLPVGNLISLIRDSATSTGLSNMTAQHTEG